MEPGGSTPPSQGLSSNLYPEPNQPISLGWQLFLQDKLGIVHSGSRIQALLRIKSCQLYEILPPLLVVILSALKVLLYLQSV